MNRQIGPPNIKRITILELYVYIFQQTVWCAYIYSIQYSHQYLLKANFQCCAKLRKIHFTSVGYICESINNYFQIGFVNCIFISQNMSDFLSIYKNLCVCVKKREFHAKKQCFNWILIQWNVKKIKHSFFIFKFFFEKYIL